MTLLNHLEAFCRELVTHGDATPAAWPKLRELLAEHGISDEPCPVCNGRGFVLAAPVQVLAAWTGSQPVPEEESRVMWDQYTAVPCWACASVNLKVIA